MAEKGTEAPTEKRRRDARKEGQVARSAELASWSLILVGVALLPTLIGFVHRGIGDLTSQWGAVAQEADSMSAARGALGAALQLTLVASIGFAGALAVVGAAITVAQVGFKTSGKAIKPKLDRVNPIKGLQRLFSVRSLWQTLKQLMLISVIAVAAWASVNALVRSLVSGGGRSLGDGVELIAGDVMSFVRLVAALGLAFAVADYAFQRRQLTKDLKMTKQQLRDEYRQTEGDPLMRQRIKTLMRDAARARMMDDVPTASVVVVNPTHYAVALRYRAGEDSAPVVVASGVDHIAAKIRQAASEHGVPVVSAPPLARTLHRHCDVGQSIPGVLYQAVAQVLAAIARRRGQHQMLITVDVEVPDLEGLRRRSKPAAR